MEKFARKCDCCGKGMNEGYYDRGKYYCSDRCLVWGNSEEEISKNQVGLYDMNDWDRDAEENPDECYYTEWGEDDIEDTYYTKDGTEYQECHKCKEFTDTSRDLCQHCLTNQ